MFRVSLILEALRARPVLMFWVAALAQGALWTLVPALFYPAPPGDVPLVLAVGKEWLLGSPYGPPLAFWAADARVPPRRRSVGVYLLSQLCVVVDLRGGVRARPPHRRRRACRHGDPADGWHQRVHGADAGVRTGRAGDAADRAALLFAWRALTDNAASTG